jgi:hypothetical protein
LQLCDQRHLVLRTHFAVHFVDPEAIADGVRGRFAVAGRHDQANAGFVQRLDGVGCRLLDRVVNGEQAGETAVDDEKDDARSVAAQPFGVGRK